MLSIEERDGVPHLTIEYSANMETRVDMARMCDVLRRAAIATGALPMAGVRVRAVCATHVSIADGGVDHGFVDISLRLRGGRDLATRKAATAQIFDAAHDFLQPAMDKYSIALSFEMRDIDPELSPKTGTIRDHLT
jgi:5-carboxymethyl-2-hydroxymuconate isomerase